MHFFNIVQNAFVSILCKFYANLMSILCQNAFTKSVFFQHGLDSPNPLGGRGESTICFLPQDMGNLWSHCVGSVRAKKIGGFVALAAGPRPALQRGQHKNVAYRVWAKNCIFGPKFCIFSRYTYETPIFWAQMDLTYLDHKFPISWGNSGYLRFNGRWSFCRLAGCFVALIA